jgi:hypothetical protein
MPAYNPGPFGIRTALLPGVISYSWGSYNDRTPPTRMSIQSVAITGNVATLAVTILEGLIPVVGSLISVQGTQTATSGGGSNFNVTNATVTAVSINSTTGVGTISYALTSANIATTTDSGIALVPQPIVQEALTGTATAGQAFAIQSQAGGNKQHGLSWFTAYGGSPATVAALLQVSDIDQDAYYTTVDQSTAAAGETRWIANITANFVRVKVSGTGGTTPTVAAGVELS